MNKGSSSPDPFAQAAPFEQRGVESSAALRCRPWGILRCAAGNHPRRVPPLLAASGAEECRDSFRTQASTLTGPIWLHRSLPSACYPSCPNSRRNVSKTKTGYWQPAMSSCPSSLFIRSSICANWSLKRRSSALKMPWKCAFSSPVPCRACSVMAVTKSHGRDMVPRASTRTLFELNWNGLSQK